jgi:hypothetical protein
LVIARKTGVERLSIFSTSVMNQPTIDPDWIIVKLPVELKHIIKNFTNIFQMRDEYGTDDLEEIARKIREPQLGSLDWKMLLSEACRLNTLVSPSNPSTTIALLTGIFSS